MQFRAITQAELAPFAAVSGDNERNTAIQQYLQGLIAGNYARLQWYWIAEHDGQWLGRLAYSGDRDENTPRILSGSTYYLARMISTSPPRSSKQISRTVAIHVKQRRLSRGLGPAR